MKIDPGKLISQTEAAHIRDVSLQAINDLIKRGKLKTVKIGERPCCTNQTWRITGPTRAAGPEERRARPPQRGGARLSRAKAALNTNRSETGEVHSRLTLKRISVL